MLLSQLLQPLHQLALLVLNLDARYAIALLQPTVSLATQDTISADFHALRAFRQDALTAIQHRVSLASQVTTFQEEYAHCALLQCQDVVNVPHLLYVQNVNPFFTLILETVSSAHQL